MQICGEKFLVMIAIVGVEPWLPVALKWCVEGAVFCVKVRNVKQFESEIKYVFDSF